MQLSPENHTSRSSFSPQ